MNYKFWKSPSGVYYRQHAQVPSKERKEAVAEHIEVNKETVLNLLNEIRRLNDVLDILEEVNRQDLALDKLAELAEEMGDPPSGCSGQMWNKGGTATVPCPETGCQDCLD